MKPIQFISTRGNTDQLHFSEAVVKGIAPDGGLYVPMELPVLKAEGADFLKASYQDLAEKVMEAFSDLDTDVLRDCIKGAYDSKFASEDIAPVVTFGDVSFLELYHGRTLAFKDMALSILPRFMTASARKLGTTDEIVILTATSGDTGKAALEGFADVPGIRIMVFYPTDGVSDIQKHQMATQEGENTKVFGIRGNFDDAQNGVKAIFTDGELNRTLKEQGYILSSANSINIGRLVPQIVYYYRAYQQLVKNGLIQTGEPMNVVVPTGNFGNILAAWYARSMGLPIKKFICASNSNNVLADFIRTGVYDIHRPFHVTASPSMDILVSSNLERLLYELADRDGAVVAGLMKDLKEKNRFEITESMKSGLKDFFGGFADDEATLSDIGSYYAENHYVMDTHTAVGFKVLTEYRNATGDLTHAVIASTASPYKFTRNVLEGMGLATEGMNDFELIDVLAQEAGLTVPESIKGLAEKPVLHSGICDRDRLAEELFRFLNI